MDDLKDIISKARAGERGAMARLISLSERMEGAAPLEALLGDAPPTYRIGITGAPGAGKSTLVAALLAEALAHDAQMAVVAIDPSSPFTGGAILGDRVRMQNISRDPRIFIRSMATRMATGGLSSALHQVARILAACGWPWMLIETVGVGQVELEIASAADTVVVVLTPNAGDEVQVSKAGMMEIADIYVINKADLPGATALRHDVEAMIASRAADVRKPVVIETCATQAQGLAPLWEAIKAHRAWLEESGTLADHRARRLAREVSQLLARVQAEELAQLMQSGDAQHMLSALAQGQMPISSVVENLSARLKRG